MHLNPRERAEAAAWRLGVRVVWMSSPDVLVVYGDDVVVADEGRLDAVAAALERIGPKSYVSG